MRKHAQEYGVFRSQVGPNSDDPPNVRYLPQSPSFTAKSCCGAPQASNSTSTSRSASTSRSQSTRRGTGNSLPYSCASTAQRRRDEQRRDRGSPLIQAGISSPIYEGGEAAEGPGGGGIGGGSDGGDSQHSTLSDEPGAWSSWVDDNASDGTGSVNTAVSEGTSYLCR